MFALPDDIGAVALKRASASPELPEAQATQARTAASRTCSRRRLRWNGAMHSSAAGEYGPSPSR